MAKIKAKRRRVSPSWESRVAEREAKLQAREEQRTMQLEEHNKLLGRVVALIEDRQQQQQQSQQAVFESLPALYSERDTFNCRVVVDGCERAAVEGISMHILVDLISSLSYGAKGMTVRISRTVGQEDK